MKHKKDLGRHPAGPANPNSQSQTAIRRRKAVDKPGANKAKLPGNDLRASLHLQKQLRQLTHQVLVGQEDERGKLSHALRDEIAQVLLGINVRLLLLKQSARNKAKGLKIEISSAQRLVLKSLLLVQRLARELENHRPTRNELTVATI